MGNGNAAPIAVGDFVETLLTPHGERELWPRGGHGPPGHPPNPSWGTGTRPGPLRPARRGALLTPHGERELSHVGIPYESEALS